MEGVQFWCTPVSASAFLWMTHGSIGIIMLIIMDEFTQYYKVVSWVKDRWNLHGPFYIGFCSNLTDCVTENKYLSSLPQSFGFSAVDVALHAGLSSVDESSMPQGESTQSYWNCAADVRQGNITTWPIWMMQSASWVFTSEYCSPGQYPKEDDILVSSAFVEAVVWKRGLIVTLKQTKINCAKTEVYYVVISLSNDIKSEFKVNWFCLSKLHSCSTLQPYFT